MSFYRFNGQGEAPRLNPSVGGKASFFMAPSKLMVELTTLLSSTIFFVMFLVFYFQHVVTTVERTDVQVFLALCSALGAFAIAIPPLVSGNGIQNTLWKSYLVLAMITIISTGLGYATLLTQQGEKMDIEYTIPVLLIVTAFVGIRSVTSWRRLSVFYQEEKSGEVIVMRMKFDSILVPMEPIDFILAAIFILGCALMSRNLASCFLLVFSYGLIFLTGLLAASIFSSIRPTKNTQDINQGLAELKFSIQEILENDLSEVYSEENLLHALRIGHYKNHKELVSATATELAVAEMDVEIRQDQPKLHVLNHDHVLARWKNAYDARVEELSPVLFFILSYKITSFSQLDKVIAEKMLEEISCQTHLSTEMLRVGKVIETVIYKLERQDDIDVIINNSTSSPLFANTSAYFSRDKIIRTYNGITYQNDSHQQAEKVALALAKNLSMYFDSDINKNLRGVLLMKFIKSVIFKIEDHKTMNVSEAMVPSLSEINKLLAKRRT